MSASQIQKGAIISYVSIFLNIAITFFYTPWMIRQIGVSNYGLYSLITTFISYFILDFGLSGTIQRFIAKYRAEGNLKKIENMLGLTTKVYLSIDTVIFLVLLILYFFLQDIFVGLTPDEITILRKLYVIAGTFSVLTFVLHPMNGAMMAFEFFIETKLLDMIHKVGSVMLIVFVLLIHGSVFEMVLIIGFSGWITSLAKFLIFRKKSGLHINWGYYQKKETLLLLSFSIWVFIIGLAQRFRLSLMPSVLGITGNSKEISIFSLGMTIEAMIFTLSSALNGLFLPKVTRMIYDGNRSGLNELMVRVGRVQLYIMSYILFSFVLIGSDFLTLWVGNSFQKSYYVVLFLNATNIITLTQHICVDVVYAENKIRYTAALTITTAILGLVLSVPLSVMYGAVGCGASFFISMFLYVVLVNIFYTRYLELDMINFFRSCHFAVLPIPLLITFSFGILKSWINVNSWGGLIVFILCYTLVFYTSLYIFVITNEEKSLFKSFIPQRKNKSTQ